MALTRGLSKHLPIPPIRAGCKDDSYLEGQLTRLVSAHRCVKGAAKTETSECQKGDTWAEHKCFCAKNCRFIQHVILRKSV
jgi:hypothetical protein